MEKTIVNNITWYDHGGWQILVCEPGDQVHACTLKKVIFKLFMSRSHHVYQCVGAWG